MLSATSMFSPPPLPVDRTLTAIDTRMCIPALEMETGDQDPSDYALPQLDMVLHAEASMVACEQQALDIVAPNNDAIAHADINDTENRYRGSWASDIPTDCFAPALRSSPPPSANIATRTLVAANIEQCSKVVTEDNQDKKVERKRLKQQRKRRARAAKRRKLEEQVEKLRKTYGEREGSAVMKYQQTEKHLQLEVTAVKKAKLAVATSTAMLKAATRTLIEAEKALAAAKQKDMSHVETETNASKKKQRYYGRGNRCGACGKM
jgi:hypothetical protein